MARANRRQHANREVIDEEDVEIATSEEPAPAEEPHAIGKIGIPFASLTKRPPLTQQEYLARFEEILKTMLETTRAKNTDYAGADDAFHNFRLIETLTHGRLTMFDGLLVRLSDKLSRVANLTTADPVVKAEAIEDTLLDNAVYSIIGILMRRTEREGFK